MRILVTGATGFVGVALCDSLQAGGHEAWVLSRNPGAAEQIPSVSRAFAWTDPLREQPPPAAFEGVDAVVHLAGESVVGRWTEAKKAAIRDSRVAGTTRLVEAIGALETRPTTLVSASAIGFYGDRGDEPLTEGSAPGDDFLAETSVAWEEAARAVEPQGVRAVQIRIGIVLESGGGAMGKMLTPAKLGLGGPLGSGAQWWSWVHRDDLIGLIRLALEDDSMKGPYNATAPGAVRQKTFAATLGKVLGRPAFLPAPAFALKLALGGFSTELLSSKRVLPQRTEAAGYRFRHPDLEGALRDILAS